MTSLASLPDPDFVRRPEVASPYEDVEGRIVRNRRLTCIGEAAGCRGRSVTLAYSAARGIIVERVSCDCGRRWIRVNA